MRSYFMVDSVMAILKDSVSHSRLLLKVLQVALRALSDHNWPYVPEDAYGAMEQGLFRG